MELIATYAITLIGADSASIHVYQDQRAYLAAGAGKADAAFLRKFPPRNKGIGKNAMQTNTVIVVHNPLELQARNAALHAEGVRAIAAFPLQLGAGIRGVMYIHFWQPHRFNPYELEMEEVFARQIEIAIQNHLLLRDLTAAEDHVRALSNLQLHTQLQQTLSRHNQELSALRDVSQVIVAGPPLPDAQNILEMILSQALDVLAAPAGDIMWWNPRCQILELRASKGIPESNVSVQQALGEGVVGRVAATGKSVLVSDVTIPPWDEIYKPVIPNMRAELAVPLLDGEQILGVLNVEHHHPEAFTPKDQDLLESLVVQAVIAIRTIKLSQNLQRQIRSLHTLSDIAAYVQDTSYCLDSVLRMLLNGVTAWEGLRFSRALLLLVDETGTQLKGRMAIGAQNRVEAETTWKRLKQARQIAKIMHKDNLKTLLDETETFSRSVKEQPDYDYPLSLATRKLSLPISKLKGALEICLHNETLQIVEDQQPDPFRDNWERISNLGDTGRAFVCVPLVGKGQAIGVLIADNRYLENEYIIDKNVLSCLKAYATFMAVHIENARLQTKLAEEERMDTWQEFTGRVAHIIGTRVNVIHGEVTRLQACFDDSIPLANVADCPYYLQKLSDSLSKVKTVLNDFREFIAPLGLTKSQLDIRKTVRSVIQEMQSSIDFELDIDFPPDPIIVNGDSQRLSDAFMELIENAQDAMARDTTQPRMSITITTESDARGRNMAHLEFINNGPGILLVNKRKIFEPFFSTKGRSSGLGLTIVKKIIEEHRGTIAEMGDPDQGAKFVILIPVVEEPNAI